MQLIRLGLALMGFISRIYEGYQRWKHIKRGRQQAYEQAEKLQNERVEKARNARNSVDNSDADSLYKNDPYRRD